MRIEPAVEESGQRSDPVFRQMTFEAVRLAAQMQRGLVLRRLDHAGALHQPARDLLAMLLRVRDHDQVAAVGLVRRGQADAPRRMGRRPVAEARADTLGGFGEFVGRRPEQVAVLQCQCLRHAALPS